MAKEQDLPLNPTKISGVCNRLLCCLTYEYPCYHNLRKAMPKAGKTIAVDGQTYMVRQQNILDETITVAQMDDPTKTQVLPRQKWETATTEQPGARESTKKRSKPQPPPDKKIDRKDKKQA
jgi:cell fate regulator YaaT (PSP1 superfamily)